MLSFVGWFQQGDPRNPERNLTRCAQSGVLIDMYARSDITQLAKGNAYNRLQWEEVTVGQALALAQIASPSWSHAHQGPVSPVRATRPYLTQY